MELASMWTVVAVLVMASSYPLLRRAWVMTRVQAYMKGRQDQFEKDMQDLQDDYKALHNRDAF